MGLLDDAIREHLELKRRRGADSSEIARQEAEAFGPARRAAEAAQDAAPQAVADPVLADEPPHLTLAEPVHEVHEVHEERHEESRFHGDPADALPHAAPAAHPHEAEEQHEELHFQGDPADAIPHLPPAEHPHEAEEQHEPPRPHGDPADALVQPTRAFDPDEVRAATGDVAPPLRARGRPGRRGARARGRARGDAGVPAGDAGARPALVRAAPPARLRLLGRTAPG